MFRKNKSMAKEPTPQELLLEICRRDPRYPLEAYEFLFAALGYIQHQLRIPNAEQGTEKEKSQEPSVPQTPPPASEGPRHVTGQQLAQGCRDLARQEFGLMAKTVFQRWGIKSTDDFGEMVYNLIGVELLSKTDADKKEDFHNVYDLEAELCSDYRINFEEGQTPV
jgi:uncharacterized repeat protein (TIGR04138 family)